MIDSPSTNNCNLASQMLTNVSFIDYNLETHYAVIHQKNKIRLCNTIMATVLQWYTEAIRHNMCAYNWLQDEENILHVQ